MDTIAQDDQTSTLIAHRLLNSVSVIAGCAATISSHHAALDAEALQLLLDKIERTAVHVGSVLRSMAQGVQLDALHLSIQPRG